MKLGATEQAELNGNLRWGISGRMEFCFELDAVERIPAWGEGEDRKPHWFGLTMGRYWIATPVGEALRYTDAKVNAWNLRSRYVDYQVAQFFKDLEDQLPRALEPVPPDLAAIVADPDWYARAEHWRDAGIDGESRWDTWYEATEWWHQRNLDTAYLVNGPSFQMWRVENAVSVRWQPTGENPEGVWFIPDGQFSVSAESFESTAYAFFERLLALMGERVEQIQTHGWNRNDCQLDIPSLLKEQQQRTTWVNDLKGRRTQTDWDNARSMLDRLSSEMQS